MRLLPFLVALLLIPTSLPASAQTGAPADSGPTLINPGFECGDGYHDQAGIRGMVPNGWTAKVLAGSPYMVSTQMWAKYVCDPNDMGWEKLEGHDSLIMLADEAHYGQDFIAPPFDLALWQTVRVTPGQDYSLSAWMTSLCGGSSTPSDCPPAAYIAKMAALDPTGGQNPASASLRWAEDRRPHTEARWANLRAAATAQADALTIFLRVRSPFQHHGNHAFADAVKLVRSPSARIAPVQLAGRRMTVSWDGDLGPDIPNIPAGTFRVSFELQFRRGPGPWQPWLKGVEAGSAPLDAPAASCQNDPYQFRLRAWAIQPPGPGSWPFHEFVGMWQESESLVLPRTANCPHRLLVPQALR